MDFKNTVRAEIAKSLELKATDTVDYSGIKVEIDEDGIWSGRINFDVSGWVFVNGSEEPTYVYVNIFGSKLGALAEKVLADAIQ